MEKHRVVITGLGVAAANAIGVDNYEKALREGKSGIKYLEELEKINLKCQIGGAPDLNSVNLGDHLPRMLAEKITNKGILYALLSGVEAWKDAGLEPNTVRTDFDSGMIFGAGDLSFDSFINRDFPAYPIDKGDSRKLGSRTISECMNSGAAAYLNSILGLGNRIQSNSSACITGSEAVLMGYEYLSSGKADRMICGSTEGDGRYIWAGFDAMRVLCSNSNDNPEFGSRPMSDSSSGFVPSGGSGALVLETLECAKARGAKIYGEILGGHVNSGGQRNGGTMTAANPDAVIDCITRAIKNAGISPEEIDLINGHLTSTKGDPAEIRNWVKALGRSGEDFPLINTPKSMIGHSVAGAGSVELVASVLQLHKDFVHANLNVENIHPEILSEIFGGCIPTSCQSREVNTVIKANFAFGDLNCALVLRKYKE
ncbi:3-oxoacyl-(acyl-carrier-protein) synthase [Ekhidna lutea]|uniref:3-oxoacyl-[acyl-carrier-protein] synthase 1 n=1 Tax=Ekhidna lutea TaxID=447679 RepID=A0A239FV76_EKHLU|nr:beta-ketoacyl-[acyl-carrier-protein] synthase family protein [Ekhidna lutea]SNS60042.1 3-oxoacyl-(acyl-carrier-protein) synthase [Ekhidna lutea]